MTTQPHNNNSDRDDCRIFDDEPTNESGGSHNELRLTGGLAPNTLILNGLWSWRRDDSVPKTPNAIQNRQRRSRRTTGLQKARSWTRHDYNG